MARNDIRIHSSGGRNSPDTQRWPVSGASYAAKVKQGEPCFFEGIISPTSVRVAMDAEGTTSERFVGIAADTATNTASVAGYVNCYIPYNGMVYAMADKLSTTINTQAKIDALLGKRVYFDNTASVFTGDNAQTDAATSCLTIVGGDFQALVEYATYAVDGTYLFAG